MADTRMAGAARAPGEAAPSGTDPDEADLPPGVRSSTDAAAVAHLFEQVVTACAVNLLLVAIICLALWSHLPAPLLLGWGAVIVALTLGRLLLYRAYHRTAEPEPRTWTLRYVGLMAPSGLAWGLAAPLFVPAIPPLQILVLVVAIAGLAAGALPINAVVLPIYLVYIAVTALPIAGTFVVLGGTEHVVMALMAVLYSVALVMAGRRYNLSLHRANELTARLDAANRELERRASHDPLTGLWNRQRFEAALDAELDRVTRYGAWCSLIMLDIDHFKQVNDSHGHETGDRVLTQLGRVLDAEMRRPDQVARWGGEEFMVLLPQTAAEAATSLGERLRRRVADTKFDAPDDITISLGVTTTSAPEERSALLKRLDDALYRAKQDGRNCVRIVPEPER